MLDLLPDGGVRVSIRDPLVYLDHCAIRGISSDPVKRAHLRQTFEARGTLMFSVMNMVEMAQNSGDSYANICGLLDELGPHCIPADLDAATVEERQQRGVPPPGAFLVIPEMLGPLVRAMPPGQVKFGTALQALQDADYRERAPGLLRHPEMLRDLELYRARARRGEKMLPLPKPKYSLRWIEISLIRRLLKDSKNISDNDINDVFHAVVPLGYARVVVLDSAWANYASSLKVPETDVFAATEPGLLAALDRFRTV
jgi:hypothetical protein